MQQARKGLAVQSDGRLAPLMQTLHVLGAKLQFRVDALPAECFGPLVIRVEPGTRLHMLIAAIILYLTGCEALQKMVIQNCAGNHLYS